MKYPFVKQDDLKDCAASSLLMIIKYYKGYISKVQLTDMLKTDKSGTSIYNLVEVAKYIGFDTKCGRTKNLKILKLPCIAYVTIDKKFTHFIVIYKIDFKKEEMLIADPGNKIKKIKFKEFQEISNDIFIILYPLKKIPYLKNYSKLEFIVQIFKKNKTLILKIVLTSLIINTFIILSSFSFNILIGTLNYDYSLKYIFFFAFLTIILLKIIALYLRNILSITFNTEISKNLTNEMFNNILHFPYMYYCNRTTGEIISRLNDIELIKTFLNSLIINLFGNLPLIIMSLIFMFGVSLKLTLVTILLIIIYFIIVKFFKYPLRENIKKYHNLKDKNTSLMVETINSYECFKGINVLEEKNTLFKTNNFNYLKQIEKFSRLFNFELILKEMIDNIGYLVIILLGALEIENQNLDVNSLITFSFLLNNFMNPIKEIIDSNLEYEESLNSLNRILELNYDVKDNGKIKTISNYDIKIKNLTFSYNEKKILDNISINIKEGEKIVITGHSGCGKSTLLKILKKYLEVDNELIKIGTYDLNDYSNEAINSIYYISQNENLFTDTLYNNLKLERNLTNERIIKISKLCYIPNILKNKPLKYNTLIEENGFNLSGGEKQRIILARSILGNFKILLIDEGTNEIDVSLERKILKNIFKEFKNKTIILVSHRDANIDLFDHLIEIENGKIKIDVKRN